MQGSSDTVRETWISFAGMDVASIRDMVLGYDDRELGHAKSGSILHSLMKCKPRATWVPTFEALRAELAAVSSQPIDVRNYPGVTVADSLEVASILLHIRVVGVDVVSTGITGLQDAWTAVQSDWDTLRSDAGDQYADQVDGVEAAVDDVQSALDSAEKDTTAATLSAVVTSIGSFLTKADALVEEVRSAC